MKFLCRQTNVSDLIIAVGDSNTNYGNKKTELLSVTNDTWYEAESYPFDWGLTFTNFQNSSEWTLK